MFDFIKNKTIFANKYRTHSEAVIVSCYFNPQNSPYRLKAFNKFYESIKHLNHRIIECVIGDATPQLEESKNIKRVYTESLLWHKETLLNKLIHDLPENLRYVFWVDADIIFTNKDWLVEGVDKLKTMNMIQPFEYCVHLERDQYEPQFDLDLVKSAHLPNEVNKKVWRSFCATRVNYRDLWQQENYNNHGHVGFAWGARRDILEYAPLYEKALIGGADHIMAHAATGQIPCSCIQKSFTDNIDEVNEWSRDFYNVVRGKIGFVKGDVYHIWHGDIEKRQYLKRVQDFTKSTKSINIKDSNGLYVAKKEDEQYMRDYFNYREVREDSDDGFLTPMAMGYATDSTMMGAALGGNLMGAMIGDMLNDSDDKEISHSNHQHSDTTQINESVDQSSFDTPHHENFS